MEMGRPDHVRFGRVTHLLFIGGSMRTVAVFMGICLLFLSSPFIALAEPVEERALRWYASASGVYVLPFTSDTNTRIGDIDLDSGFGAVGAAGIEVPTSLIAGVSFYGEVEGGSRTLEEENDGGKVQTTTILANVGFKSALSPSLRIYTAIGAGVGMHDITVYNGPSFDDTVLALQYVGGLEYALTDSFSTKLGYRFLGTANAKDQGFEATYRTHGVEFGLLYYF